MLSASLKTFFVINNILQQWSIGISIMVMMLDSQHKESIAHLSESFGEP